MRKVRIETILCACGCGKSLNRFDLRNRERKYLYGHSCKGWNKGIHRYLGGKRFKEGHLSWNKDRKGVMPIPWNKGKEQSDVTKEKISLAQKGEYHSPMTEFKKGNKSWSEGIFGKNNPCWKENKVTPMKRWIRIHTIYQDWREIVMKRDNYTCQICGERGGNMKIHVDHYPKTFREIIEQYNIKSYEELLGIPELFDVDNGRTLCDKCHKLTPTWGGRNKRKKELCWVPA